MQKAHATRREIDGDEGCGPFQQAKNILLVEIVQSLRYVQAVYVRNVLFQALFRTAPSDFNLEPVRQAQDQAMAP
jgi:hypothetical protein